MTNNKLFVGNLPFKLSESDVSDLFGQYGEVVSCSMPTDRDTGRKRGFAFVEMKDDAQAEAAIQALNGRQIEGRALSVSISQPKQGGGGGGGGGGGPRRDRR
jgi:RNA recognition motif-containing protein